MRDTIYPATKESELYIVQCGEEACEPAHAFGPASREYYLIHFVASGCGTFYCQEKEWHVGPGQGFLIVPHEETFYQASDQTPWHYAWVGFRGERAAALIHAAGLDAQRRVFTASHPHEAWDALSMMRRDAQTLRLSQMASLGGLLRFMSLIAPVQDPYTPLTMSKQYSQKAMWFLEGRFDRDVSIQETADFVGVSRSHLYRIMMEEYGCSPKEMLLRIRLRHARQFLAETALTLDEIAHRIGFGSGTQFGAAFRSAQGISPGAYRREQKGREFPPEIE